MFKQEIEFRTVLKWSLLFIFLVLIDFYLAFQARFLLWGPQIELTEEPGLLHNKRQIYLTGYAFNISRLWLNDRQIYTDANGNFKEALILENGYTIATLRAEDRYGRETKIRREFVYRPMDFIE